MATISIDVPNPVAARVADAFGAPAGTAAERIAFVKAALIADVKDRVRTFEADQAAATARTKADAEVAPS